MMSVLLVASVVSMIRTSPEYGAWDPVQVRCFLSFQLLSLLSNRFCSITGRNGNETLSGLGNDDCSGNDLRRDFADASRLPPSTIPDPQS